MEAKILNGVEELKLEGSLLSAETNRLHSLVDISEFSDLGKWKNLVERISPTQAFDNRHRETLYEDGRYLQAVMWVKKDVPTEVHNDRIEKILILEGTCTCCLGDEQLELVAGDCLVVPINTIHNLLVTSPQPVKMIYLREMLEKAA